jgi:DNA-binding CsgD family transcriptional regulator
MWWSGWVSGSSFESSPNVNSRAESKSMRIPMRFPPTMSVSTLSPTNIALVGSTPTERTPWRKMAGCGLHERAAAQGVDNGSPVPLGRALPSLGSVQPRRQHKADARRSLGRAVALFDEADAVIWRDRARRKMGRIGGRSAPAGDDLTPTERDIARLVAVGCSRRQVAHHLHLSVKTVEWNLSKIYRKVGVRSRAELIARHVWTSKPGEPSG